MFLMELDRYSVNEKVSHQLYIDPRKPHGSLCAYINHSCDPNCDFQKWYVDGLPRIAVYTKTPIVEGSFLSISYNITQKKKL